MEKEHEMVIWKDNIRYGIKDAISNTERIHWVCPCYGDTQVDVGFYVEDCTEKPWEDRGEEYNKMDMIYLFMISHATPEILHLLAWIPGGDKPTSFKEDIHTLVDNASNILAEAGYVVK